MCTIQTVTTSRKHIYQVQSTAQELSQVVSRVTVALLSLLLYGESTLPHDRWSGTGLHTMPRP